MQSILGTARNISLDLVGDKFVSSAELIIVAGDLDYTINATDGSMQKNLACMTHRFKLNENDIESLLAKLAAIKAELASLNVDISVEDSE